VTGHSAGGWLGRACLGDGDWCAKGEFKTTELVSGLCCLGTPQFPPETAFGFQDMTKGALSYVSSKFPGAFLKDIFYVSVAGAAVVADKNAPSGTVAELAASSYPAVTGLNDPGQIGDGIVPLSSAHLPGAIQVTLPRVYHSINAPKDIWYGGDRVIDFWLPTVLAAYYEDVNYIF